MRAPHPRVEDREPLLYVERCRIVRSDSGVLAVSSNGKVNLPVGRILTLLLGPGTSISHDAAIATMESGACIAFTSGGGHRFFGHLSQADRSSANLQRQAKLWANRRSRLTVARAMYVYRFGKLPTERPTLRQLRGHEGRRIRELYRQHAARTGVAWPGRKYGEETDPGPVNIALSTLNACLYAVTHAAVIGLSYSPALGFIHTGHHLSFVLDVADLYKGEIVVPAAFNLIAKRPKNPAAAARRAFNDLASEARLLQRIPQDLHRLLADEKAGQSEAPGLWAGHSDTVEGGISYG